MGTRSKLTDHQNGYSLVTGDTYPLCKRALYLTPAFFCDMDEDVTSISYRFLPVKPAGFKTTRCIFMCTALLRRLKIVICLCERLSDYTTMDTQAQGFEVLDFPYSDSYPELHA